MRGSRCLNLILLVTSYNDLKFLIHFYPPLQYERYTQYIKVMKKVKQNPANSILEKASKSLAPKSKPLSTLVIGEEQPDDESNRIIEE